MSNLLTSIVTWRNMCNMWLRCVTQVPGWSYPSGRCHKLPIFWSFPKSLGEQGWIVSYGNSENKMDDLGVPHFRKPPYSVYSVVLGFGSHSLDSVGERPDKQSRLRLFTLHCRNLAWTAGNIWQHMATWHQPSTKWFFQEIWVLFGEDCLLADTLWQSNMALRSLPLP